jgi:hypothetical protein
MVKEFMKDRMFPMTLSGLQQAIKALKDKKVKFEGIEPRRVGQYK